MVYTFLQIKGEEFKIHELLRGKLDNVKKLMRKEWDVVFLIDGIEGSGKSTLSFICAWYISDGKLTMDNICEGTEDAVDKLNKLPKGSVLIIDEGSLMFSSTEVMRREQRQLVKILNVIRQKCMCLIVVAPSFFNINKYISCDRSRFLLHVYTDNSLNRGRFCYFGQKKKKKLYAFGKKKFNSYSKPKSDWTGHFHDYKLPFNAQYQRLKTKSLQVSFKRDIKVSRTVERDIKASVLAPIAQSLPIKTREELAKALNMTRKTLYNHEKAVISPRNV